MCWSWSWPTGTILNEIMRGWRFPAVVGKIGPRIPLEYGKIWRIAQARTDRPVKFGVITADAPSSVLRIDTDLYDDDKRSLLWDLAAVVNTELRELAAAGCTVIQIEDPDIHTRAAYGADDETLDFLVDLYHRQVEGLDDVLALETRVMSDKRAQEAMSGYHELVRNGRREIYKVES